MSNWKDAPHLFVSGEFKFKRNQIHKLNHFTHNLLMEDVSACTLIARPISDMTDEEIHRATEHMIRPHSMSFDVRKLLNNKDDFRLALNLISIGVLPKLFEEGFKTGTVINVNEL